PHPIYIRLAKGGDRVVTRPEHGFRIGQAYLLREAEAGYANPVLLVGTGVATTQALDAADMLARDGIACHVLHVPTVKPLDVATIAGLARTA
ncbi:transketolase C-terminal domain-containing protein, partial [Acinetobacter baumannii]